MLKAGFGLNYFNERIMLPSQAMFDGDTGWFILLIQLPQVKSDGILAVCAIAHDVMTVIVTLEMLNVTPQSIIMTVGGEKGRAQNRTDQQTFLSFAQ